MNIYQYIEEIIGDIVSKTSTQLAIDATYQYAYPLHYEYGSLDEINNILQKMTGSTAYNKYKFPLVALFTDISEKKGQNGIDSEVNLNIALAMRTDPHYTAVKRMSESFKPILIPIYQEFLNQVILSRKFRVQDTSLIPHEMIKCFSTGRQGTINDDTKLFNDFVDVVLIRNLNLKLIPKNCYDL